MTLTEPTKVAESTKATESKAAESKAVASKTDRLKLSGSIRWVPVVLMRTSINAQRDLNQARVNKMAADFDLDRIGIPVVSNRDGYFYIIDGQHRVEALRAMGWGDQKIECVVHEGLTETQEAEMFLVLNDTLTVSAFDKYTKAVTAGRPTEAAIDRIVRASQCAVSRNKTPGSIGGPGTLVRIYQRAGGKVLSQVLHIARDAYGDAGLDSPVLDGLGYLCQRYDGSLDTDRAIACLSGALGGVQGLMNKAEQIRRSTGKPKGQCVAAAAVEIINAKRGGPKLASWWRAEA